MENWKRDEIPILQLGNEFYDPVQPAAFPKQTLRYWNDSLHINFDKQHFVKFNPLPGNLTRPLALRYHGHQFQHYNPQLGDGRGFLFGQIKKENQWYDFGTKGSGQTPYSRSGDGRLTLKGAFREALATEMLESLGVKTSRTLSFFETGEDLERNDEPSPTRSAVLTRFSSGHIRIGTFQRLAFLGQLENVRRLTSYSLYFYHHQEAEGLRLAETFLNEVIRSNAKLVAQVMLSGFVHGVLNTDNINIAGELFDYGPYRFLPTYDPNFTAAYFDHQGLYCYGRQPHSFLWALHQLAGCLKMAWPELDTETALAGFSDEFNTQIQNVLFSRLNLKKTSSKDPAHFFSEFFNFLNSSQLGFEKVFFDLHSKRILNSKSRSLYEKEGGELLKLLESLEVADEKLPDHSYFQNDEPCTLLIDEIESLWKHISDNDDWSPFENKLSSIRQMRGVY